MRHKARSTDTCVGLMSCVTLYSSPSLVAILSRYNRTLFIVYATLAYSSLSFFNFFYIGHICLTHAYSRLSSFNSVLYICLCYTYTGLTSQPFVFV